MSDYMAKELADARGAALTAMREADAMRVALVACRLRFAEYVALHRGKGTPEGDFKADANQDMVDLCDKALAR